MSELLHTLASYVPKLIVQRVAADPTPITTPTAERLPAAVLFADISGFSTLTERLAQQGPSGIETLSRVLNRFFGQLIDIIADHGGDIIKFAGDSLVALWPVASDQEDGAATSLQIAAQRATQCSLAVQTALPDFESAEGISLSLKLAVGAGDVIMVHVGGVFSRWEFVLAGSPLNQVGAAEHLAQPGDTVLSPEAWALVADQCRGQPLSAGCVRLEAVHRMLAPQPTHSLTLAEEMGAGLKAYIPGAILARLSAGQTGWLAELRRVTVIFINLPDLNADAALEHTHSVMRKLQTALYHYEGSVNKITVDDKGVTLVAALGLPPLAHEDDAARGVQAALDMQAVLREMGLRSAIGIACGRPFCGSVGNNTRREYTMIGGVVNLAARLMQAAAGDILGDEATYRASQGRVKFETLPAIKVKGKDEPVAIFRPLGAAEAVARTRTELIGRSREKTAFAEVLQALLRGSAGDLVVVEGEAGIGKSRLVEELLRQARALGVRSLVGAGDAIEKSTAYLAWRPVFRKLLSPEAFSENGESDYSKQAQRRQTLSHLRPDYTLIRLAPLLKDVLPVDWPDNELTADMTGEVRAANTRELLVRLLLATVAQSPWLLILEDAHWMDSASWALALDISRRVQPLLVVVVTRPMPVSAPVEYRQLLRAAGERRFQLETLSPDETIKLVTQRLGVADLPQPVASLILEKAEGQPFFSEELAYALRDAGLIQIIDGVCQVSPDAGDVSSLKFPDTIDGVITSRIDRLSPQQQLTLKVASVIGRVFGLHTLGDVYPIEEDKPQLPEYLNILEQLSLTLLESPEPDLVYLFKHAITQEVAYNLMLFAQRRKLHRAVAEWYEHNRSEDLSAYYPLLAHHWSKAEVISKGIDYSERAGEQALRSHANQEAVDFFSEAIKLASTAETKTEPFRQARWERQLGEAYLRLGQLAEARTQLEQALARLRWRVPNTPLSLAIGILRQVGRQIWQRLRSTSIAEHTPEARARLIEAARAYESLAEVFYFTNNNPAVLINTTLSTLNFAELAGPSGELARGYVNMGYSLWVVALHGLARFYFRLAEETVGIIKHRPTEMRIAVIISLAEIGAGEWGQAQNRLTKARDESTKIGDRKTWAESTILLEELDYYHGEFEQGAKLAGELVEVARQHDNRLHVAWGLTGQAENALRRGEIDQALAYTREALELYTENTDHVSKTATLGILTLAQLRKGEQRLAEETAQKTAQQIKNLSPPTTFAFLDAYSAVAEVYLTLWERSRRRSDADQKKFARLARRAVKPFNWFARVFAIGEPRALMYQGWYWWLSEKRAKAEQSWRQSIRAAQRQGMPYEEGVVCYQLGRHSTGPERQQYLTRAADIFTRLGAAYDLTQAQAATQNPPA